MLEISHLTVTFNQGTVNEKKAIDDLSFTLNDSDFVTIIGSNGAGKSTLLGAIAGNVEVSSGTILNNGFDMTHEAEHKRAQYIGRLYQDPLKGTAPHMTIEENLELAYSRGRRMRLGLGSRKEDEKLFVKACAKLGLGLEDRMKSEVGLLSGGQRQALTLLMATLQTPELLLLDEHTAALDPVTSDKIMGITQNIVKEHGITTLMVTHNVENALRYGNKTLVMSQGKILKILEKEERKNMTITDVMKLYNSAGDSLSDTAVLG
ncbi:MAG: ATP-binding cassette domain-containing protein [Erysipelotrichia bacterium]|nr:ATP-binding cassette domain-containing protein [Erysipelotrichia bacterium]